MRPQSPARHFACHSMVLSIHVDLANFSQGLQCHHVLDSSAGSSFLAVCSIVGHFSPLGEDTSELKDGDVVKMCASFPATIVPATVTDTVHRWTAGNCNCSDSCCKAGPDTRALQ